MPTERETIGRERAAYMAGVLARVRYMAKPIVDENPTVQLPGGESWGMKRAALLTYPDPAVPRVVADPDGNDVEWCVLDGEICSREAGDVDAEAWTTDDEYVVTPARVRMWADLLANPTTPDAGGPA